ncbi:hypothetical protein AC578_10504 [Pseudocercospora eumusae]|uniref:Aminotransferase class V domain-containing protein n=1 Tax=Pseudocercospora eumusae TaxID=321146 RepID=A0A139H8H0_9PEZI|nr:hypothetical protein AC578_10504 [Pseudocercospora eumusae]
MAPPGGLRVAPDDEAYWLSLRATMAPMYINTQLVNSRRSPAPLIVRDKIRSVLDTALSYELDEYEPFKEMKESGSSVELRAMLAEYFGTSKDEIAFTRNAMEGIATVLNGFTLQPGDEILATRYCYDFNLAIIRQRVARDGIHLKLVHLPFGPARDEDILKVFGAAVGPRTKLISFPHVVGRTGLVFPVRAISDFARDRGIFTFVDGAHSAGHLDLRLQELGCDAFAACLHKWMHGPRGTGFLYIRKAQIANVWPLIAPYSDLPTHSIEKFEEVGTVFKALAAAVPEMIKFNTDIGQAEKTARYQYMRARWATRLGKHPRVRLLFDPDATPATGFGAFVVDGMTCEQVTKTLLDEFDIHLKAFKMEEDPSFQGITICPGLANTVQEIDAFVDAALAILSRRHQ